MPDCLPQLDLTRIQRGATHSVAMLLLSAAIVRAADSDRAPSSPADESVPPPVIAPLEHPTSLDPAEAVKLFIVPDDLQISLVSAEPDVSQPLSISFDDRGRMWVLQYLQYPNPEGL